MDKAINLEPSEIEDSGARDEVTNTVDTNTNFEQIEDEWRESSSEKTDGKGGGKCPHASPKSRLLRHRRIHNGDISGERSEPRGNSKSEPSILDLADIDHNYALHCANKGSLAHHVELLPHSIKLEEDDCLVLPIMGEDSETLEGGPRRIEDDNAVPRVVCLDYWTQRSLPMDS
ncbi:Hypothetical protein NTJ_12323 [Nesidiocoris tenuis]|uniref:Uncharacterized protein n=1 Tax=Nesidiocoris tenuis TaxID=355587 RepID=A0ABN7B531_9HEMI|nr:Hypothetical protein NTJ_12323 [Nesidiocoris tenuis]